MHSPLTKDASLDSRNAATDAISRRLADPTHGVDGGHVALHVRRISVRVDDRLEHGVRIAPGSMALARMPTGPYSTAM